MKSLLLGPLLLFLLAAACGAQESEFFGTKKGMVFNGDPDQPLVRTVFLSGIEGYFKDKTQWDVGLGGDAPFFQVTDNGKDRLAVMVRGYFRSRFGVGTGSFDLINADYTGGINTVYGSAPGQWELFVYHKSSHLGDEVMSDTTTYKFNRINYSREVARLMYRRALQNGMGAALGCHYILRKDPSEYPGRLAVQYDMEVPFALRGQRFFANLDLKSNEEHGWNTDTNLQLGIRLGKNGNQSFLVEYYDGYSHLGQFFDRKERYVSLGIIASL